MTLETAGPKIIEKEPYPRVVRGRWNITEIEEGRIFEQRQTGQLVFVSKPTSLKIPPVFRIMAKAIIKHLTSEKKYKGDFVGNNQREEQGNNNTEDIRVNPEWMMHLEKGAKAKKGKKNT